MTRIAYLDCFAGISGDMFLGALLDAGVPLSVLEQATQALHLDATLRVETVSRSGIAATKVHVLEHGRPAEEVPVTEEVEEVEEIQEQHGRTHGHEPETQHRHKGGHTHEAAGATEGSTSAAASGSGVHAHGRSLSVIRQMIAGAELSPAVKQLATKTFELLGQSEAKIHNVPVETIHFHEVGAVDAIVDIVAAAAGIVHLGVGAWHSSPVNVGSGMVRCAHGLFPVPAPATADLLRGFPTYSAHVAMECVTPTGAALLRVLNPSFGAQPAMSVTDVGYGAGSRDPEGFPNVLRLSVGEAAEVGARVEGGDQTAQLVTVLEAALDDATPQLLAYVAERALQAGALDVMLTPVVMKKGRPGTLLTVLCQPEAAHAMERLLLAETTTLGVRVRDDRRTCLERSHQVVPTRYGEVRMKLGMLGGETMNATPEFEDCRSAAVRCGVPLKEVLQEAVAAFRAGRSKS